jgi:hypothetical protein
VREEVEQQGAITRRNVLTGVIAGAAVTLSPKPASAATATGRALVATRQGASTWASGCTRPEECLAMIDSLTK